MHRLNRAKNRPTVAARERPWPSVAREKFSYLEFFAGGGMARLGLGPSWRCAFANDFDAMKRDAYCANFGDAHYRFGDVHALTIDDLPPDGADLAWASSPCQDLSLAGARRGLAGARSGAFFGFWRLVEALGKQGRAPRLVVVENVTGLLTSNGGEDFAEVVSLMAAQGYCMSAIIINADAFVPQSRPRLFIIGAIEAGAFSRLAPTVDAATPAALFSSVDRLPLRARQAWRWISARPAQGRNAMLSDCLDEAASFDPAAVTNARIAAMTPRQRAAIRALAAGGERHVGAAYRRIRIERGVKLARIEARFDGVAGCVRTPAGGSSRQIVFVIEDGRICSRLMTAREAARIMGLPDDYRLPPRETAALKLVGDGVAPPVVDWLAREVLEPVLAGARAAA
jgi:DNA (cytosine-5)-methyltransferase 1